MKQLDQFADAWEGVTPVSDPDGNLIGYGYHDIPGEMARRRTAEQDLRRLIDGALDAAVAAAFATDNIVGLVNEPNGVTPTIAWGERL